MPEEQISPASPPEQTIQPEPSVTPLVETPPVVPAPVVEPTPSPTPEPAASESTFVPQGGATADKPSATPVIPPPAPEAGVLWLLARAKLEKIAAKARREGSITNDGVQKLLRVSDATATRYLSELVRAGRLKRVGHPRNASYQPVP